ncbi:MAG: hypothetical protein HY098_08910 [Nitrospinae bacterium]|nr:hypothetical protein [Nitrospinota bacterium]
MKLEPGKEEPRQEGEGTDKDRETFYKDSGIREKHGYVPLWLWGVVIALVIWAVYYTVKYWSPPPG